MFGWVVLGLAAVAAIYAATLFNSLVKSRQMVAEGWSGIDVQLKRRTDLVPRLVEAVKAYASYEQDMFERIARLRGEAQALNAAPPGPRAAAENALTGAITQILAVAEAYPRLKASESFLNLHDGLVEIEDHIQLARRYYNGAVRQFNTRIEQFPSNLVAAPFGFRHAEYFELDDPVERLAPRVQVTP